jgi:hypothetical protein
MAAGDFILATHVGVAITSWTPTLTSNGTPPSLGSGTDYLVDGVWMRAAQLIYATGRLRFGVTSPSAGTGDYLITLPVAASALLPMSGALGLGAIIGSGAVRDNSSVNSSRAVSIQLVSTTTAYLITGSGGAVGASTPWTWAASDGISFGLTYPIA